MAQKTNVKFLSCWLQRTVTYRHWPGLRAVRDLHISSTISVRELTTLYLVTLPADSNITYGLASVTNSITCNQ